MSTAINDLDGYKTSHLPQYVPGCQRVYTNETPRSTKYLPKVAGTDDKVVVLGHTYFIKHFLIKKFSETFFSLPLETAVKRFKRVMDSYLGKDAVGTDHIASLHRLGFIPVSIRALDEGVAVNAGIPILTIENTLPEFFWVTNYLETIASCYTWMMCNNATIARKYRKLLETAAMETVGSTEFVKFQAHDFSFRGMSSPQSAEMSGFAHLTSFVGTDTVPALEFAEDWYGANLDIELVGCSVPASEHSVACSYGKDNEFEYFRRLVEDVYPTGIVSLVSDSFDYWQVIFDFLPRLKDSIMTRHGKVVIRPDSGDPFRIICGYTEDEIIRKGNKLLYTRDGEEITEAEFKGSIQCLWEIFGGTTSEKGFKVLDSHISLIYGDSITLQRCKQICDGLKAKGFASTNVVFGIGSLSYQYSTRDTCGFAFKATDITVNGVDMAIFKDPKTDSGSKKSARGKLVVLKNSAGDYVLVDGVDEAMSKTGELKEVFRNGKLLHESTLQQIRDRVTASI